MFKGNLLKYVKLLDTPFLVGIKEGNGESSAKEERSSSSQKEAPTIPEEDINRREELKRELKLLEERLKGLQNEAQALMERAKDEASEIKKRAEEEAKRLSQRLLEEAQREAERLKAEASKAGYKEGYDKGFAQGYAEGLKEGKAQYEKQISLLKSVLEEIRKAKERLLEEVEPEIIDLIKIALRKILLREVELDRELVIRVIKTAIKKLEERSKITLRVSPEDLPKVVERREELKRDIEGLKELEIVEDPRVGKGGCIVEGSLGVVDARIERQVEEIERLMDRILKEGREEGEGA